MHDVDQLGRSPSTEHVASMHGGSYSGYMTLATATRYNHLIACSVDVVGMSQLVPFLGHTEPYRMALEYGDERDPQMREFLESIAPMNHVNNVSKPMFVVAGVNDPRVPKSEADQMVAALKSESTPVWYLAAKDEGHALAKKKNSGLPVLRDGIVRRKILAAKAGKKGG
jgi:dipeptidyl aminopeptidase/acylaminoacyl peptidase